MPLVIFAGIIQFAMSPRTDTCIALRNAAVVRHHLQVTGAGIQQGLDQHTRNPA